MPVLAAALTLAFAASLLAAPPKRVATFTLPATVHGHFDHLGLDPQGGRLFLTAETVHEVLVFNLHSGRLIHTITGIAIPHSVLYRRGINRLYVTDGGAGEVRIYNGTSYQPIGTVKLKVDSDSITYDAASHRLYAVNGGGDAHETFSMVSVVDTDKDVKVADIRLDGSTVEQLAIDPTSHRLYAANPSQGEIDVIDRSTNAVLTRWPVTLGSKGVSVALDPNTHRLFVGCRSGVIVVFDTRTGKQIQTLPIASGIDDLLFNPKTRRLYATCGAGSLFAYQEDSANRYDLVENVPTAKWAKNEVLDESTGRLYTTVPPAAGHPAQVYVYQVKH